MSKEILYGLVGLVVGVAISGFVAMSQTSNKVGTNSTNQSTVSSAPDHSAMGHQMSSISMDDMMKVLNGKTGDEFDRVFIEQMIPHHQGAIDMAELAIKNAGHQEIKDLAQEIIKAQKTEIKMMEDWKTGWWGY